MVAAFGSIAACTNQSGGPTYYKGDANAHIPNRLKTEMAKQGMPVGSPVLARVFKEENKVEIWKQKSNGRFGLLASYDICKYSGKLGPKYTEGDRQAPEGFYSVRPAQMNPQSKYHLSFDMGYPNKFDRANNRTGANLMVHGACSSSGCYSMNDGPMTEIYAVARESFKGGQTEFQIQAYPFRMTATNMARYANDVNMPFWRNLKEGYDAFELTKTQPKVDVCGKRYVFNQALPAGTSATAACPASVGAQVAAFQADTGQSAAFAAAAGGKDVKPPKPSIQGIKEAELVKDWTKRRARGERISMDPPTLNPDGSVTTGSRMGRANSEAGRRMAALEAEEAAKKREAEAKAAAEAEEKRLKDEAKARAAAEKEAARAAAAAPPVAEVQPVDAGAQQMPPAPVIEQPAPAQEGIVGNARRRLGALIGG